MPTMKEMLQYLPLRPSNEPKDQNDPESTISFLPHECESEEGSPSPLKEKYSSSAPKSFCRRHSTTLTIHLPLFLGNILFTIFILLWSNSRVNGDYTLVYTPLQDAVSYKKDVLTDNLLAFSNGTVIPDPVHKEFGPPSPELEAAWHDLLEHSNIRLSKDELNEDFRDKPGLAYLSDGSGIYSSVAVFHSIHCIKRLRYLLYFDHYHPNRTEKQVMELKQHGEHCLSYLLHSAKCNADLTVFPMQWGKKTRIPFGIDQGHHQCKNWEKIQDWMKERSIDIYEPGLLIHPTLGWAYSNGVENVTGVAEDSIIADAHEGH